MFTHRPVVDSVRDVCFVKTLEVHVGDKGGFTAKLKIVQKQLAKDLTSSLVKPTKSMKKSSVQRKHLKKTLPGLEWQGNDLEDLTEKERQLWAEVDVLVDKMNDQECDIIKENIARCVTVMRTDLLCKECNQTQTHSCNMCL